MFAPLSPARDTHELLAVALPASAVELSVRLPTEAMSSYRAERSARLEAVTVNVSPAIAPLTRDAPIESTAEATESTRAPPWLAPPSESRLLLPLLLPSTPLSLSTLLSVAASAFGASRSPEAAESSCAASVPTRLAACRRAASSSSSEAPVTSLTSCACAAMKLDDAAELVDPSRPPMSDVRSLVRLAFASAADSSSSSVTAVSWLCWSTASVSSFAADDTTACTCPASSRVSALARSPLTSSATRSVFCSTVSVATDHDSVTSAASESTPL